MWVVGVIPISVAGIGVLEGGITVLFVQLAHTTREQAACLALCQRFILILTFLPGALVQLLGGHLPKTFSFGVEKLQVPKTALEEGSDVLLAVMISLLGFITLSLIFSLASAKLIQ